MKYKPETYYKAIEMRNEGYRIKEISEELRVKYETLRSWLYHGKKPNGAEKREAKRYKTNYEPEIYYEIIKLWNEGYQLKEIKEKHPEIPVNTMKNWVQGAKKPYTAKKLSIKRKRKLYKYNEEEIIKEILKRKSTGEIAEKHNITHDIVYNLKRKHGLMIRHTKNHYDFSLAAELTEKKRAYLIGLIDDFGIHQHTNYYELKLTTTHITYLGLIKKIFRDFPYYLRFAKRIKKYKGKLQEIYESEIRIATPTYSYLVKGIKRKKWINWAINNQFLEFLAGLMDADGSVMITKGGGYIVMVTNSKKYLVNKVKAKLEELGLNPKIRYNKESRCYQLQIRREDKVKSLLKRLKLKHPEKVFIKHLILTNKFSKKQKSIIYKKYRKYVKQRSQKWIEREYGLSLLRYYPPLPLSNRLKTYKRQ